MPSRHLMLDSTAMGRKVHLWCYGHFGLPVIAFPSAAGFAHEWHAQGMVDILTPLLNSGRIKLYCPESNVSEAWTHKTNSLDEKMAAHARYERFILETLVPFIRQDCRWPDAPITAAGCSLGGTYAALFSLKFPETFTRSLCMSGRYLTTDLTKTDNNEALYYNNPLVFVPNLSGKELERVQKNTHLTLVCGQGPYEEGCIEETIWLARALAIKQIPHLRDIWGKESKHDWDWWHKHALLHFNRMF